MRLSARIIIITVLFLVSLTGELNAQSFCSGPSCSVLPLSQDELNEMLLQFKVQYTDVLVKDMSDAGNSAVLSGTPGSPVMDGHYYGGLNIPVGYKSRHDVWIVSPKYQNGSSLESAGVAILPRLQFGYRFHERDKNERFSFLENLELFGSYFDYKVEKKVSPKFDAGKLMDIDISRLLMSGQTDLNMNSIIQQNASQSIVPSDGHKLQWKHAGFMARYRFFGVSPLSGRIVEFGGLSAGLGYYEDIFKLDVLINNQKNTIKTPGGDGMQWNTSTLINYKMKTMTIPAEVKTGLRLFTFLQFNAGAGVAWTKGNYKIRTLMAGDAVYVPSNMMDKLALMMFPPSGKTYLAYNLESQEKVDKYAPYFRPGIEFHMGAFKIAIEGIMLKGAADTFIINFAVDI